MTRKRWWQIGVGLATAVYGFTGGCYAERVPPRLSVSERMTVRDPLPYSVTVVPWDTAGVRKHGGQSAIAYATSAFHWLDESGAFVSVKLGAAGDSATTTLTASSMGLYCNSAIIPILTILSVGIIPTVFTDRDCWGIVFHAAHGGRTDSVIVRRDNERTVVMGWLAVPLTFLPGWSRGVSSSRVRDRVRLAILDHRKDLAALSR
ncbi:MAG: hypothetical protein ACREPM_07960 [Gemmatimonadaceae bacterium]